MLTDGIDEVKDFPKQWHKEDGMTTTADNATPLDWCLALMKRDILKMSTIILSSRYKTHQGLPYLLISFTLVNVSDYPV